MIKVSSKFAKQLLASGMAHCFSLYTCFVYKYAK